MGQVDVLRVAAVIIFAAAVAVAVAADQPLRRRWPAWVYPAAVIAVAAANIVLTVATAANAAPLTGMVLLGSALLLGYAMHRRARATGVRRPPPTR
jgi:hypothetical protein